MIIFLYKIIRFVLMPLIGIYIIFSKKGKARYQLERKINSQNKKMQADYAFEVSSEGELEQVRALLNDFLDEGKKIELIFSSTSLLSEIEKLQKKHETILNVFIMPFLSYIPFWGQSLNDKIKAPKILMCRYDFLPEMYEIIQKRKFYLFSASSKSYERGHFFKRFWYNLFFKKASLILASNMSSFLFFKKRFPQKEIDLFDLRILRIDARIKLKETHYKTMSFNIQKIRQEIEKAPLNLILGSLWAKDLEYISKELWEKTLSGELLVYVLPHCLEPKNLDKFRDFFKKYPNVKVEDTRGVLCELYSEFDNAFIGGGFEGGDGVHSLLEPFSSHCKIFCAPHIERSTEYDYIIGVGEKVTLSRKDSPLVWEQLSQKKESTRNKDRNEEKYQKIKFFIEK